MESDNRDALNLQELAKALDKMEETQNNVGIAEFLTYRELFVNETADIMDRADIRLLSTRFIRRFNPYKPISVFDAQNNLMFKVPQLFVPIQNVAHAYLKDVDKFRSGGVSEIPKYQAEAVSGLLSAIIKTQRGSSNEGYESYGAYVRSLREEYKNDMNLFEQQKRGDVIQEVSSTKTNVASNKTSSGNIDTIAGLSWD